MMMGGKLWASLTRAVQRDREASSCVPCEGRTLLQGFGPEACLLLPRLA